jgi:hypothetical protein
MGCKCGEQKVVKQPCIPQACPILVGFLFRTAKVCCAGRYGEGGRPIRHAPAAPSAAAWRALLRNAQKPFLHDVGEDCGLRQALEQKSVRLSRSIAETDSKAWVGLPALRNAHRLSPTEGSIGLSREIRRRVVQFQFRRAREGNVGSRYCWHAPTAGESCADVGACGARQLNRQQTERSRWCFSRLP